MKSVTPRAAICTLGCKVNQYESQAISEELERHGFMMVPFDEDADVYIINTCTVTAESDRKARQMIRRAVRRGERSPFVIVTGCMAQTQTERISSIPGVSYVCGTRNKMTCVEQAVSFVEGRQNETVVCVPDVDAQLYETMEITSSERTRAYVKIEDGCENRCTYCKIPQARGRVCSRPPEEVISELERLCCRGYREVVLTGIEVASYGRDFTGPLLQYRLIDLLEAADQISGIDRIRLSSLEPTYMKPDTVSRMARLHHLAPHFHLSVQSASDRVLAGMRRKYNAGQLRAIMADIRAKIPRVQFTTDMIAGFPCETEEDFAETVAFVQEQRFLHVHVFPFSPREGTVAAKMSGQLSNEEKNHRGNLLISKADYVAEQLYQETAGTFPIVQVLVETVEEDGSAVGHTDNFMEVHINCSGVSPVHGQMLPVKITGSAKQTLFGVPAEGAKTE